MEQEVLMNEEVVETAEDIIMKSSGKGLKITAGIGIAAAVGTVGFVTYKFVVKPMIAKIKAKKDETVEAVDGEVIKVVD